PLVLTGKGLCDMLGCPATFGWGRSVDDREYENTDLEIDQKLIAEGAMQLTGEIKVLEAWLRELDEAEEENEEILAVRKSYNDMLRSRKEMLTTLEKQVR
ncbi:MAG: hypothetical protein OXI17_10805, partial [Gammaproteobacteria bacterium]|nr:hypothetical protein [Gammaproteobacteria bacterium]